MILGSGKGFAGIDERIELQNGVNIAKYMRNFRVTDSGSIVKRNAVKEIIGFGAVGPEWSRELPIYGLWTGYLGNREYVVISIDGMLCSFDVSLPNPTPSSIGTIPAEECIMFEFNGFLYIKAGEYYGKFDGTNLYTVEGYIPCVAIGCAPSGGGEILEQINLICDKRRVLFSPDGKATVFNLPESGIDSIVSVKLDGVEYEKEYSLSEGSSVQFNEIIPEGINSLEIIYSKRNSDSDRKRIFGCTKVMLFGGNSDGRAFLWGNPDFPNYRFHSDLADGIPSVEYFPVNAFTVIGNSKINCIVQQYDRQLIFTKNEAYYSYSELQKDALGNIYSSFPVFSLNGSKGCLFETDGCIINNRPVTLCDDGLNMWESTSVQNEKNAICFSSPIGKSISRLLDQNVEDFKMFDFQANRELYFIHDGTAYIYNYGNGNFYIYDGFEGSKYSVFGSKLYIVKGNTLYVFGNDIENDKEVDAVWESAQIAAKKTGRCDVIGLDTDIHVRGPVNLKFGFKKGLSENMTERDFVFTDSDDGFMRISFRPTIKRAMPFSLKVTASGKGKFIAHGFAIKTREKERSFRIGLQ